MADEKKNNKKPVIKDLSTLNPPLSANLGVGQYIVIDSFGVGKVKANNGHGTGSKENIDG